MQCGFAARVSAGIREPCVGKPEAERLGKVTKPTSSPLKLHPSDKHTLQYILRRNAERQ